MKLKKILSIALCTAMLFGLAGCGDSGEAASSGASAGASTEADASGSPEGDASSSINFDEDPYTLRIFYPVGAEAQPDVEMIQEKINEIALPEINCTVDLEPVSLASIANTYALAASAQEKMDLMILFPGSVVISEFANNNMIKPIGEYVDQWGSDITRVVGERMKAGEYKGQQYTIPQNQNVRASATGFNISKTFVEKYDIDIDSIKTFEDLEALFEMIHENEPGVVCVMPEGAGGNIATNLMAYGDNLGVNGVTLKVEDDGSMKVIPATQAETLLSACQRVREWYEKGYISQDILTDTDGGAAGLRADKCFASASNSLNFVTEDEYCYAVRLRIDDELPLLSTANDQLFMWGVASSCERPDKAIQFLNLCYARGGELANLMRYGVEGVHYTVTESGGIDTSINANWQNYWFLFGDYEETHIQQHEMDLMGLDSVEEYKKVAGAWNVQMSPAYGFTFDSSAVKTQISAVSAVCEEYQVPIMCGTVDPETQIAEWESKMYAAGLQDIIDEIQTQLDEWSAAQ